MFVYQLYNKQSKCETFQEQCNKNQREKHPSIYMRKLKKKYKNNTKIIQKSKLFIKISYIYFEKNINAIKFILQHLNQQSNFNRKIALYYYYQYFKSAQFIFILYINIYIYFFPKFVVMYKILLLLLSLFQHSISQVYNTLELQKPHKQTLKKNDTKIYKTSINHVNRTADDNLFFVVQPLNNIVWEKIKIEIYTVNEKLQITFKIDCTQTGIDACYINAKQVLQNQTIYASVQCLEQQCQFQIHAYWSQSFPINPLKKLLLDAQALSYAKILTLNLQKLEFNQMRIVLIPQNFTQTYEPIKLYGNYGKKAPTVEKSDLKGIHLWNDGQGIFLSRKNMKQLFLTFLIQIPAQTACKVQTQLIKQYDNKLQLDKPLFDYLGRAERRVYFINLTLLQKQAQDLYIRLSTYTGKVKISLYPDKTMKEKILLNIFQQFGQTQFKLSKHLRSLLNLTSQLYIMLQSYIQSTYLLTTFLKKNNIIKLLPDVTTISQLQPQGIQSYFIKIYRKSKNLQDVQQTITMTNLGNKLNLQPQFSLCADQKECAPNFIEYKKNPQKYNILRPTKLSKTGSLSKYHLTIKKENLTLIQQTKLNYVIILVIIYNPNPLTNKAQDVQKYSLSFIQNGKIKSLKQNKPQKDRLILGEQKYYKFINIHNDTRFIRIHLIQISGSTSFVVYRKDPRMKQLTRQTPQIPFNDKYDIIENLQQPIYICVKGKQNSFFALSVQIFREIQINQQFDKSDSFNYLVIAKQVQYKFSLGPDETQILQIPEVTNGQYYEIILDYTDKPQICATHLKYPRHPNCDFVIQSKSYKITHLLAAVFLGIKNPFNKNIIVKVKYTSLYGCEQKKTGQIWKKYLQQPKSYCVSYLLTDIEQIEAVISLADQKFKKFKGIAYLNDKQYYITSSYIFISKQTVSQACKTLGPCNLIIEIMSQQKLKIQIVTQYVNQQIVLLDGISQVIHGSYNQKNQKHFKFDLANYFNTTIALESKIGSYQFYIKILDALNYKLNWVDKYATRTDYHFKSKQSYYSQYTIFTLSHSNITKYCSQLPCICLITVMMSQNTINTGVGTYSIQVTQQVKVLKQHTPTLGHLQQNSFNFYSYQYPKNNGTLVISLNTQNKNCANFYVVKGEQSRASSVDNIKKNTGNQIIIDATKGIYSITVEALQQCFYTISVSATNFKMYELVQGIYKDITLNQGQIAYFFYYHYIDQTFKVMSLQQYGQVQIYGNITSIQQIQKIEIESDIDINKLNLNGPKNFLRVQKNSKFYGANAIYLFAIKALKKTETTILIYLNNQQLPLKNKKSITDYLTTNQTIKYKVYDQNPTLNITVMIHFGQIQITTTQNQLKFSKIFKNTQKKQTWELTLSQKDKRLFKNIQLVVKANQNSLYQFQVITNKQEGLPPKVKSGLPTYLFLSKDVSSCITGTIQQKNYRLILTVPSYHQQKIKKLSVTGKMSAKVITKFNKQIIQNVMILSFDMVQYYIDRSETYTLCFQSPDYIGLTIVPVGSITLLPQKTSVIVQNQKNFSFSSAGKLMLEVFQCQQTANVLLSSNYSKIGGTQSQIQHWKRFGQNYIVQFQNHGLVYLNVKGSKTLIKWNHVNEDKGEGLGYYLFKIPTFKFEINEGNIKFTIESLIKLSQSKQIKVNEIKYTLYVSDNLKDLKKVSQCSLGLIYNLVYIDSNPLKAEKTFEFDILVQQLNNSFFIKPDIIYASIVAEVEIKVLKTQAIQNYKFIYDTQQIKWKSIIKDMRKPQKPQQTSNNWKIIKYIAIGIVISAFLLLCSRSIVKVYLKYKNKNLLQTVQTDRQGPPHDDLRQQQEN